MDEKNNNNLDEKEKNLREQLEKKAEEVKKILNVQNEPYDGER